MHEDCPCQTPPARTGQPPIVETVLKKIDAARVFVADMTFVAKRPGGGASPNPNVLIEYGWALKSLTYERVIRVMNTAYGEPSAKSLPFDLRHARWPFCYELHETAAAKSRTEQRRTLTAQFRRHSRVLGLDAGRRAQPQSA